MLPETMKAVVAYSKDDYRYTTVPTPRAQGKDLILKVEACGVCAGDIKCQQGGFRFWGGEGNPAYAEPPFIPGHELLGYVAEVGPEYDGPFRVGDRITTEQIVPCGKCRYCREGKWWLCDPHNVYGFKHFLNGGFAEYVRLPENSINYAVPVDMPLEKAVLIEPFACALHAVDRARIEEGDIVAVAGAGTLGLGMIAAMAQKGHGSIRPKCIISIEPDAKKRELVLALGADVAMPAWTQDGLPDLIAEMTENCGVDVYIDASGHTASISQGLQLIKKGGRFVEMSVFPGPAQIDWSIIGDAKELDLYGSSLSPHCYPRVIEGLADGSIACEGVLSHVLPLSDFAEAFAIAKRGESVKIALKP
ncbi:MAG: alcohol dehydrogenase catalytic domain-containing protein [Eubacteriales bacterium]|nr:alcohol dehydrogenase catalytic domain-containing protein [Eubacteriales bacterium]